MAKRRLKQTKSARAARARYRKKKAAGRGRGRGRKRRGASRRGGDFWGDVGAFALHAGETLMQAVPMMMI